MSIDMEAIRQMARDSADKDGVLTDFDKDQIAAIVARVA